MNLRYVNLIKNRPSDYSVYFKIYKGGNKILNGYLDRNLSEFKKLNENLTIIKRDNGLVIFEQQLATVIRYYNIYQKNETLALCKLKNYNVYFFIRKSIAKNWIKKYNEFTKIKRAQNK